MTREDKGDSKKSDGPSFEEMQEALEATFCETDCSDGMGLTKLSAGERIRRLIQGDDWLEDGRLARCLEDGLIRDAVYTGIGRIHNRRVCIIANDPQVKAGSWAARTVEKMIRMQETAMRERIPIVYLIDSAGIRIDEQVSMYAGRRGAGRLFYNQVLLSGLVPQIAVLLGPAPAGGAYFHAFCDITIMVRGLSSTYIGSPRLTEVATGEKTTLEKLGGAEMHCTISGCGDILAENEDDALAYARKFLDLMPDSCDSEPPKASPREPELANDDLADVIPADHAKPFDIREVVRRLFDEGSFFELKALYAPELMTALVRLNGCPVGLVANQPAVKGGVLFSESALKAAKFIELCDAFGIPLCFLVDTPGFMVGEAVERQGIIRHGARMIAAVSQATVSKVCVILRKAYGAGLYAMGGPAFDTVKTLALPDASIAVMGPEAAVNAIYARKLSEMDSEKRAPARQDLIAEYKEGIKLSRLGDSLVIDDIVQPAHLRKYLVKILSIYRKRSSPIAVKRHPVSPM